MIKFREIATIMDPVRWPQGNTAQPISLRELARCYRWVDTGPSTFVNGLPSNLSIKQLTDRHSNPATTKHKFLVYNAFLMRAEYPIEALATSVISIQMLLTQLNQDAGAVVADLVGKNVLSKDGILGLFSISTLEFMGAAAVIGLISPFSVPTMGLVAFSLTAFLKVLNSFFDITELKILEKAFTNPLSLLHVLGIDIGITVDEKPALAERTIEIADELVNYDVAALCEVWNDDVRDNLVSRFTEMAAPRQAIAFPGPLLETSDDTTKLAGGSGLLVVGIDRALSRPAVDGEIVFGKSGVERSGFERFIDADLWAKKGVMLTLLEAGAGMTVEIYSTHLYNGGEIIRSEGFSSVFGVVDVTDDEKLSIRAEQLAEFTQFFNLTHDIHNVALFVGDLNLSALDPASHDVLTKSLASVGLKDAWPAKVTKPDGSAAEGFTNGDPNSICNSPTGDLFCVDDNSTVAGGSRIDYIFVTEPTSEQFYNLDLTRIRRRSFPRGIPTNNQFFLSDHLGLDMTLIVSPKS